ncbi:MAG: LysE family translocator [Candidatus Dormibacteria bacterium]
MSLVRLVAFAVAAAVLAAAPGPSVVFVVSRSLVRGRRAGLGAAVGDNCGKLIQLLAVAAGAGLVLEQSVVVFEAVKLVGAAYLVYLGVQSIRHRRQLGAALASPPTPPRGGREVWEGLVVGASNPKGALIMTAVLPQFVDPAAGAVGLQVLALGGIFLAFTLAADCAWAVGASAARARISSSPQRLAAAGAASGTALIGLGLAVAVTGRSG